MDKLTTTIKREWLREIIAGRKRVEYRQLKPYWTKELATVKVPFSLRGMSLWLLKFSGGSVDDYAICRSS